MKGSIQTDLRCPVCGLRLKSLEPRGLYCPAHPEKIHEGRCRVMFDNVCTRVSTYREAYKVLTRKRAEVDAGTYDLRDYKIKSKPLAFKELAKEWLVIKAAEIKPSSWRSLAAGIRKAVDAWGSANIKTIQFAHLQDFFMEYPGAPKSRANALYALKQFWQWVADRYDVPVPAKWPRLGHIKMAFRATVDIPTQEAIINDVKEHEPFRVWLCIKWLATYIGVRPGEMQGLTEGQVDRSQGLLIIPHPKEGKAKLIPLIQEDIEIVRSLPLAFDRTIPFFRHESARGGVRPGRRFGGTLLYYAWKRACDRLGVQGVSLYPGTKHSTAMGLRAIYTPEQIQAQTLHSTGAAFRRYFQTGGEDLRKLLEGRKTLTSPDNGLTMDLRGVSNSQVFDFKR